MKVKPKVTSTMTSLLPVLLLSAITAVESPITKVMSRSIPTQIASPIKDIPPECDTYDTINLWSTKQLRLSHILAESILLMETFPNETCGFYEKDAMQSLYENVEKINRLNGSQSEEFPKIKGDLTKDLNQILPWFKKLVPKGFKKQRCCEELERYLIEVEEHFQDKWEDLKKKISIDIEKEKAKIKDKLQENQENLDEQLKDIQQGLENIQKESGSNSYTKCCAKFSRKINSMLNDLNNVNTEANEYNQEIGEKLKKMQNMLESQDKKAMEVSETLGKREKNMKEMVNKFEKENKGSDCFEKELEERVKIMENRVKEHADKIESSASNMNITLCKKNGEKLAKIETQLEKLLKDKNKQGGYETEGSGNQEGFLPEDRIKTLLEEANKLQESLKNSELCYEKTDHLYTLGDNLLKSIDQMNQTFDKHIKNNDLDLNEIESLLKDAMDKLGSITNNSQNQKEGSQTDAEKDFQNQLSTLKSELDKAKDNLKNLQNKLSELPNPKDKLITSDKHNLNDKLKEGLKKFNENFLKADTRLSLLEKNVASKSLDQLGKLLKTLQQDINKLESEVGRLENPEKSHKAHLEKLTNLENQITPCRDSCKDLDKINDLLDRIEDLERFFKTKLTVATKPKKGTTKSIWPGVDDEALVGGIDWVEQQTDPTIFRPSKG